MSNSRLRQTEADQLWRHSGQVGSTGFVCAALVFPFNGHGNTKFLLPVYESGTATAPMGFYCRAKG